LELPAPAGGEWSMIERIRMAATAVQRPILFSLVIIIAAYIPLLTLERVERRLFTPMAMTVCFALLGSLLLCLTFVPTLATFLFKPEARHQRHRLLDWIASRYEQAVSVCVRHATGTVAVSVAIVAGSFYLGSFLGTEFLPSLDEGVIWIRANLPPGISMKKSAEVAARMRELIMESPEIKLVTSQTGRNDDGTDPFGPNRNELLVDLKPYRAWRAGRTKPILVDELRRRLQNDIPGVALNFTQPIIDTSTEIATGSSADLAVIIRGADRRELRKLAESALAMLRTVRGAADTSIEQEGDQGQLRIAMKRYQIARYGINVSDVQDVIDLAIGGSPITGVFEGERRFDVVARFTPAARSDPESIGKLLIPTKDGGLVPLS